jgi:hypothetical protein
MITKNGILRPNRNISLITNSKLKSKPEFTESNDPDSGIDFNNIPTIKGTYTATKLNSSGSTVSKTDEVVAIAISEPQKKVNETIASMTTSTAGTPAVTEIEVTSTIKLHTSTTTSSTERIVPEITFIDFRKPDLETSPWRPIIPTYMNSGVKVELNSNMISTTTSTTTSTTITSTKFNSETILDKLGINLKFYYY